MECVCQLSVTVKLDTLPVHVALALWPQSPFLEKSFVYRSPFWTRITARLQHVTGCCLGYKPLMPLLVAIYFRGNF